MLSGLLSNNELVVAVVGAVLAFVLGIVTVLITQWMSDRKNRVQITYSIKSDLPLTMRESGIAGKMKIFYENEEIKDIKSYKVNISNSGKKLIKNQDFKCVFPNNARIIDFSYPKITTIPKHEVGPIEQDKSVTLTNEFRYTIKKIGVGQIITLDFLMINAPTNEVDIYFTPNDEQEISFVEGEISLFPTLEENISKFISNLMLFFIFMSISFIFPSSLNTYALLIKAVVILISIPFLIISSRELITILRNLVNRMFSDRIPRVNGSVYISGSVSGIVAGALAESAMATAYHTDPENHNASSQPGNKAGSI